MGDEEMTSSAARRIPKNSQQIATSYLLELLSTEIARDGGASLVTNLKDYTSSKGISPKRLNSLLVEAIQKPRLMAFLEAHDIVFDVDRTVEPHWVKLKCTEHVDWASLEPNKQTAVESQLSKLQDKILCTLRHRYSRMERRRTRQRQRQQQQQQTKEGDTFESPTTNVVDGGANIGWLLRQCTWNFHEYLRAAGIYLDRIYPTNGQCSNGDMFEPVLIPGTKPWEDLVLGEFSCLLLQMVTHYDCLVVDAEQTKIWFQEEENDPLLVDDSKTIHNDLEYLSLLDDTLTELVHQDGATQVRLEVLLHRHQKMKRLLGGRDLWDLVQRSRKCSSNATTTAYFERLDIFQDGPDIVLQLKNKNFSSGRMRVDNEGLFSVANGKWGTAIARAMVNCCYQVGWARKHKKSDHDKTTTTSLQHDITAIDLTASVGGMTLGLAKTRFFSRVIGIEIDPHRANLCRENMANHMVWEYNNDYIDIRTMDAMDAIPYLPRQSCLVIDPPGEERTSRRRQITTE